MTSLIKEQVGEVLYPLLSPFHKVDGQTLLSVWEREVDGEIESISFEFNSDVLTISVDGEDDTIEISLSRAEIGSNVSHLKPWQPQIGKTFGWGWLGVNQQGYIDSVALSFGAVVPQFNVTAISSALHIAQSRTIATRKMTDRRKATESPLVAFAKTA